jgi:hypothetical protein
MVNKIHEMTRADCNHIVIEHRRTVSGGRRIREEHLHHCDIGPAIIVSRLDMALVEHIYEELWCCAGKAHKEDGPAYKRYKWNGDVEVEEYHISGNLHRDGAPARIERPYDDGTVYVEDYYSDGQRHRDNGPARIIYSGDGSICYQEFWSRGVENRQKNMYMKENGLESVRYKDWPSEHIAMIWLSM